ncbi:UNVERIFIED_CONTAM: putative late blight resistance proteinR1A-10 [Sesamum angustifolium]|uniref:Late blight resistance proteinR1A-10 n=1 Tax=Sesamum angustifolium TaxID=2727405 RepID=A0AAW2QA91_9LAMI
MAYAAVVSLKHTIQRLLNSSQIPIPSSLPEIIQLTYEKVESLQELFTLEDGSNNQRVKAVEREIREAARRLEDVLESAHLSNHHHFLSQSHETLNGDFSIRVKEEIIFFTETVKKIEEQLGNASLPEEEEDDVVVSSRIDQYFGLKKPKIVGLTDELLSIRDSIIDFPYEDPERLIVVAVEGMAGIGKTALVTAAYLHPRINRRYLIVVDDVWNTRVWDELKKAFPDDRNNSRVIVTTWLFNIAKHASSTIFLHRKRFLNDEESWHLLREKVFGGEKNSCPSHLDEAGRKIAENCQGLPLMIITLAKHLSQAEKTAEYWEKVAKKEHSDIIAADEEFFKVLAPSYHHLPQHLKACFLYMGIFPLDYNIPASNLIKLWCAEEFLESNMTTSLEYVAMESLDQLMYANVVMICEQRYIAFTYNGELPASISKLQNLQYLIVHQYLSIISSGAHRWYLPMEIWNMEELKHLEVMGSDLPEPSYDTAYLCNLLTLSVNPKHISQVVSTPPRVPIFPSNIRKLTLSGFGFPWEQMSTIAHLPELQVLKLRCNAFQGQEWTTYEGEFPQLQFLLLEDIDLRYWTAHHPDSFPLLSDLMIRHCYKLERIPPKYGGKPYLRIDLIECNPGLVAFAKEEILKKDELENESRLMLIKIESSTDDRPNSWETIEAG